MNNTPQMTKAQENGGGKDALLSYVPYFDGHQFIGVKSEHLYTVSIHADMVKIKANNVTMPLMKNPPRGSISTFSRKSRKRMIELLADEIRVPDLFVTLTLSDDLYEDWMNTVKPMLEAFRRRLERKYEGISALWRLEIEDRKSGDWIGEPMPHFHLIIWLPENMKNCANLIVDKHEEHNWSQWWHDITGSTHPKHLSDYGCDISRVKSRRHGYHYVSKYAAKPSIDNLNVGRRWGRFGVVGQGSRADIIINKKTYIELKRLIVSYQKRMVLKKNKKSDTWYKFRNKKRAKMTARNSANVGLTAFGLGVWNAPDFDIGQTTLYNMIVHARQIAADKEYYEEIH